MVVDDLSMKNYQLFSIFVVLWAIPYSAHSNRQSVNTQIPERSPDINVWTPVGSTDASAKCCEAFRESKIRLWRQCSPFGNTAVMFTPEGSPDINGVLLPIDATKPVSQECVLLSTLHWPRQPNHLLCRVFRPISLHYRRTFLLIFFQP